MSLKKYLTEAELAAVQPVTGDEFDISIRDITNIETFVLEHTEGSITIALDETAIKMLEHCGCTFEEDEDENEEEQVDELAPLIGAVGRAALPLATRAVGSLGGAALSGVGSLAGGALSGIGSAVGGAIKGIKNATNSDDEEEEDYEAGSLGKQLALADKDTEEEKIDELAPLKALAGIGAKMVKLPTSKAAGQVVKSVGKAIDKKVFGPRPHEEDYEESINRIKHLSGMKKEDLTDQSIKLGDKVKSTDGEGKISKLNLGRLYADDEIEVKTNNGTVKGGLEKFSKVDEAGHDTSPGGPYDRGAADAYYGRASKPHKVVPYTGADGVKGQMQKVALTDPAEIAAYEAGYSEAEFGEKDYGESIEEAEYQGRKVQLGKPMQGDVKKFKVYVKDPSTGNVKKVNFGDPNMRIRKSNPARRESFRARHNCDNPGPRTKARYWSCRKW